MYYAPCHTQNLVYVIFFLPESIHLAGTHIDPGIIIAPAADDMMHAPLLATEDVLIQEHTHVYVEEDTGLQRAFQPEHEDVEERVSLGITLC